MRAEASLGLFSLIAVSLALSCGGRAGLEDQDTNDFPSDAASQDSSAKDATSDSAKPDAASDSPINVDGGFDSATDADILDAPLFDVAIDTSIPDAAFDSSKPDSAFDSGKPDVAQDTKQDSKLDAPTDSKPPKDSAADTNIPDTNPGDCIGCLTMNCADVMMGCITSPACLKGIQCSMQNCMGNGSGGNSVDIICMVKCFDGDFQAAMQAMSTFQCITSKCGPQCADLGGIGPFGASASDSE